jgi:hypothetical protein
MNNATVIKAGEIVVGDLIDFGDGAQRYILSVERLKTIIKVEYHSATGFTVQSVKRTAKVTRY